MEPEYEDLGKAAFDAMLKADGGLKNVEGSTKRASDSMRDNFGTKLQTVWRQTQEALLPLGLVLLDMAEQWLPKISTAVQTLSTWFQNLSPAIQRGVVIFGLIAAAIGPVLVFIGSLISALAPFISVIVKVWGWLSKLRMIFTILRTVFLVLSGPVGIVIGILAALVIIGIKVYQNWDTIKKKGAAIWGAIWGFLKKYGLMMLGPVGALIAIGIKLYKNWDTIKAKISAAASAIWSAVKTKFEQIKTAMMKPIEAARDKIKGFIDKIKGFFTGLKLKIPKISLPSLPKLKITGKLSLAPPSVPHLKWLAKGGIATGAQIVGIGEKGPEAVIPLMGKAMQPFAKAIANQMPNSGLSGALTIQIPVYLNGREIARASAGNMDQQLETIRRRTARNRGITT